MMLAPVLLLLVTGGAVVSAQKPELQAELLEVQEKFVQVKVTKPVADGVDYIVQYANNGIHAGPTRFTNPIIKVEGLEPNTDVSIFIKACGPDELKDCTDQKTLIATTTSIFAKIAEVGTTFVSVFVLKPRGELSYLLYTSHDKTEKEFKYPSYKVEGLTPGTDVDIFIKACGPTIKQNCTDHLRLNATTTGVIASFTQIGADFVLVKVTDPQHGFSYLVHTSKNQTEVEFRSSMFRVGGLKPLTYVDVYIKACMSEAPHKCSEPLKLNATTTDWPAPINLSIHHQGPDNDAETTYSLIWKLPLNGALINTTVSITDRNASRTETIEALGGGTLLPLKYGTSYDITVTAEYLPDVSSSSVFRESEPLSFKTIVGKPGPVRNLTAVQWKYTNEVYVSWELPEYPKGTPARYTVEVRDEEKQRKAKLYTNGDLSTNATIHKAASDTNYTVEVIAANHLYGNKYVDGTPALCILTFEGPEKPEMLQIGASADSVAVQVQRPIDDKLRYYVQANHPEKNATFQVSGYKPYTNITIFVAACFGSSANPICSELGSLNATTNVGEPAPVESLAVKIIDDKPALSWNAPKELNGPLDGYEVTVVSSNNRTVTVSLDANSTSYTYEDAIKCERYNIGVSAFNLDIFDKEVRIRGPPNAIAVDFGCSGVSGTSFPGWATALIVVSLLVVCIGVGIAVAKRRGLIDTNLPTVSYSISRS